MSESGAIHGREQQRPADEDKLGAQRKRLEHVGTAPDASVQHHGHAISLGGDLGQRAQGGHRTVELAAAMIGDDHAIDAALARDARIGRRACQIGPRAGNNAHETPRIALC
jgi:hypothetical protein